MSKRKPKTRGARPTIGYLAPQLLAHLSQWTGIIDAAQKHDVNLICFPGWSPGYPSGFLAQANILYDLVTAENVDGLITWASSIGNYMTPEELQAFHERYHPLPMVAIGSVLEGIPGLLMDSYEGMREAVAHLIEVHGYRRLAFIRGPEGHLYAQERYRAYTETLEAHSISLDPNLVTPPAIWGSETGREMMELLLDERGLRPRADFEAVVAVSDDTLFGALGVLQARGMRVPRDVAAIGFDDRPEGRTITPPLTSVTSPFYRVGYQSVEMLLALMEGKQLPKETTVPSRLVVRQSCGCLSSAVAQVVVEQPPEGGRAKAGQEKFEAALAAQRKDILAGMVQAAGGTGDRADLAWAGKLLDGFAAELGGESPGAFLAALEEVLRQVATAADEFAGESVARMQNVVSALRRSTLPCLSGETLTRAEELWQQARVTIGETAQRVQASRQLWVEQQAQTLREIGEALITTFDVDGLVDVLAEQLPGLGIPGCYLSLYENPQPYEYLQSAPKWSRLILAYNTVDTTHPGGRIALEPGGRRFRSQALIPGEMQPQGRQYSFLVESLYFREHQLGFALFEIGPRESMVYDTLRGQISSAMHSALIVQQLERRDLQLQTATEVSQAASSLLDLDELIRQAVNLIRERFNLYYAGLFLVDQSGEWTGEPDHWAVLRAGTGAPGQQMLAGGHKLEIGGESMIGQCVAHKQARIALDVGEEAVRFDNPFLPETRSELALPLVSRGEAIGALTIQSAQEVAFTQEDIAMLQTMADQLANAITNARLYEQAEIRADELTTLNQLGQALTAHLTVQEVLKEVHRGASRLMDATNFYVAVYNAERHEITFSLDTTQEEDDQFVSMPADQGITGYIIRHRTSVLIEENVSQRLAEMGIEMVGKPALSWLGVPIILGDRVLGVIGVQSFTTPRAYDAHDRDLLIALATQAAIAIDNARMFEKTEARARREQVVRTAVDRIRRAADREDIIRIAAQEINQLLGASHTIIHLGTQEQLLKRQPTPAREVKD